jgi:hypothetical protein
VTRDFHVRHRPDIDEERAFDAHESMIRQGARETLDGIAALVFGAGAAYGDIVAVGFDVVDLRQLEGI